MIELLTGTVAVKTTSKAIIDVNGVGYGVEMPLSSLCNISGIGEKATVWIETHVREDAIKLFGFASQEEKDLFNIVCSISGVGPKIGLAILGALRPEQLVFAATDGQKELLEAVPGIGKRLAERLVVELKPKIEKYLKNRPGALSAVHAVHAGPGVHNGQRHGATAIVSGDLFSRSPESDPEVSGRMLADAQSALENLGFKDKDVSKVLGKIWNEKDGAESFNGANGLTDLIRGALAELRGW